MRPRRGHDQRPRAHASPKTTASRTRWTRSGTPSWVRVDASRTHEANITPRCAAASTHITPYVPQMIARDTTPGVHRRSMSMSAGVCHRSMFTSAGVHRRDVDIDLPRGPVTDRWPHSARQPERPWRSYCVHESVRGGVRRVNDRPTASLKLFPAPMTESPAAPSRCGGRLGGDGCCPDKRSGDIHR